MPPRGSTTALESAVRRRRIRFLSIVFFVLLLSTFLFAAFLWSDLSVTPGLDVRYVSYASADGTTVVGVLFVPRERPGPLPGVLVVHDFGSHKEALNRLSVETARHGFVVLAIDLRDHGMSSGRATLGAPDAEPEDVEGGLQFLREQVEVNGTRLALVGYSFGGTVALLAAAKPSAQVNATVVWAAPTNLTALRESSRATFDALVALRIPPDDVLDPAQLALRSPVNVLARACGTSPPLPRVCNNSTLFLHGDADATVPVNQSFEGRAAARGNIKVYEGLDHSLDSLVVLDDTISFIELMTKGSVGPRLDPIYSTVERDRDALAGLLTALLIPFALLAYERVCTRTPERVLLYNYPGDTRAILGIAFFAADASAYLLVVWGAAQLYPSVRDGLFFHGVLPSPGIFAVMGIAGAALCAVGYSIASAERSLRGRDDRQAEEAVTLWRSAAVATIFAVFFLFVNISLQALLFQGANTPRSGAFLWPLLVSTLLALGLEYFLRLRLQRRLRGVFDGLFGREGWLNSLANVATSTVLYFLLVAWAVQWLLGPFLGEGALGLSAILTLACGLLSSLLFDRTHNILAGSLFTGLYLAWLLNDAFHF